MVRFNLALSIRRALYVDDSLTNADLIRRFPQANPRSVKITAAHTRKQMGCSQKRRGALTDQISLKVDDEVYSRLVQEASEQGFPSLGSCVRSILEHITDGDLFGAVLDA